MPPEKGSRGTGDAKPPNLDGKNAAGKRPSNADDDITEEIVVKQEDVDEPSFNPVTAQTSVDVDAMMLDPIDMRRVDYTLREFLPVTSDFVGMTPHPQHDHMHWEKIMFDTLVKSEKLVEFGNLKGHSSQTFELVFTELVHSFFPNTARLSLPEGAMEADYEQGVDVQNFLSKLKTVCAGRRIKWDARPCTTIFERPLTVQVWKEYFGCGIHKTWDTYCALYEEWKQMSRKKRWDAGDGRSDAYYATIKRELEQVWQKITDDLSDEAPYDPAYHGNLVTGLRTSDSPQGNFAVFQFISVWLLRAKVKSPVILKARNAMDAYDRKSTSRHHLSITGTGVSNDGQSAGNANIPTYIVQLYATIGQALNVVLPLGIYPFDLQDDQKMPRKHFCAAKEKCYWIEFPLPENERHGNTKTPDVAGVAYWRQFEKQLPRITSLENFPDVGAQTLYMQIRAENLFCSHGCMGVVLQKNNLALCAAPECTNVFYPASGHMCNITDLHDSPMACCNSGLYCCEDHRNANHTRMVCWSMNKTSRITSLCSEDMFPECVKGQPAEPDSFNVHNLHKLLRVDYLAAPNPQYGDFIRILGPLSGHHGVSPRLTDILRLYYLPYTYKFYHTTLANEKKQLEARQVKRQRYEDSLDDMQEYADCNKEELANAKESGDAKNDVGCSSAFQEVCVNIASLKGGAGDNYTASLHVDWTKLEWVQNHRRVKLNYQKILDDLKAHELQEENTAQPVDYEASSDLMLDLNFEPPPPKLDILQGLKRFLRRSTFGKPYMICNFQVASAVWDMPVLRTGTGRLPHDPCERTDEHPFLACCQKEVDRVITNIDLHASGYTLPLNAIFAQPDATTLPLLDYLAAQEMSDKKQKEEWTNANSKTVYEWLEKVTLAEVNLSHLAGQRNVLMNESMNCTESSCNHDVPITKKLCLDLRIEIAMTEKQNLEENEPDIPTCWSKSTLKFTVGSFDPSQRANRGKIETLTIDPALKSYEKSKTASKNEVTSAAPELNTVLFLGSHFSNKNPVRFAYGYDLHDNPMTALFSNNNKLYVEYPIANELLIDTVDSSTCRGFRRAARNAFRLCYDTAVSAIYAQLLTTSTPEKMSPQNPEVEKPETGPGSTESEVIYVQHKGKNATAEQYVKRTALQILLLKNESLFEEEMVCIPGYASMIMDGIKSEDGVTDIYYPRNTNGRVPVYSEPRHQAGEVICFPEKGHKETPTGVYSPEWAQNPAIQEWMWTNFFYGGLGLFKTLQVNNVKDETDPVYRNNAQTAKPSRAIESGDSMWIDDAEPSVVRCAANQIVTDNEYRKERARLTATLPKAEVRAKLAKFKSTSKYTNEESGEESDGDVLEKLQTYKDLLDEAEEEAVAASEEKAEAEGTEESDHCVRCGLRNEGTADVSRSGCLIVCETESCNFSVCAQCMPSSCSKYDERRFLDPETSEFYADRILEKKGAFYCPPCSGGKIIVNATSFTAELRLDYNEEAAQNWLENQETVSLPYLLCGTPKESFRIMSRLDDPLTNNHTHFSSPSELQEALRTAKSRTETQKLQHQLMMKQVQELSMYDNWDIGLAMIREMNDSPEKDVLSLSVVAENLRKYYRAKCFDRYLCIDDDKIMKPSEDCTMIFGLLAAAYKEVDDTKPPAKLDESPEKLVENRRRNSLADSFEKRQKEVFEQELNYALEKHMAIERQTLMAIDVDI